MGSSREWRIWSGLLPFTVTLAVTSMTVFHGNKVIIDQEHCISYASNQSTDTVDCSFSCVLEEDHGLSHKFL